MCERSMSNMEFLIKNYNTAPVLKRLDDYTILEKEEVMVRTLIYHKKRKITYQYLGNIINTQYKKQNPEEQSNWNTDTVRLHYIIRSTVDNHSDWIVDKKGNKMTQIIIEPLLEYVKNLSKKYVNMIGAQIQKNGATMTVYVLLIWKI